ncbi:MAG: ChaN family lipoprotein [Crocinitomicaceae bacterium]
MTQSFLAIGFLFSFTFIKAQSFEKAFIVYTSKGKKTTVNNMLNDSKKADCILFGEFHDNPITHWLQLETAKFLSGSNSLCLGFEMFESDQQQLVDDYLSGKLNDKQFSDSCRLWPNYETDYKPLIELAKQKGIPCIASNVKRKYASLLFKKGRAALDTLSEAEKNKFASLDFKLDSTLSQYREVRKMGGHGMGIGMMEAQAFKDATMAMHIQKYLSLNFQVLHFNGAFHSDYYQGILWYLMQNQSFLVKKKLTISTVSQEDITKLDKEHFGKADYIICVSETMTKTH